MAAADADYGNLGLTASPRRWLPAAVAAVVVVLVAGLVIWLVVRRGDFDDTTSSSKPPSSATASETTGAATSQTTDAVSDSPAWTVAEDDELPGYITEPVFYEPGSPEAEIEVAFVNGEIAAVRALAEPTVVEPELEEYQTGFALRATTDSREILLEDGQVIRPGPLTRIEIEDVTILSDSEADVEACHLYHDFSVVVDDTSDQVETLTTLHGVFRLLRDGEGRWQLSELVTVIQDVDGFGACLDITLTPAEPGALSDTTPVEPEVTSS